MPFVVDASVALAWYLAGEATPYTDAVLDRLETDQAVVPCIWLLEVTNVLVSGERQGRFSASDVSYVRSSLSTLPVSVDHVLPGQAFGAVLDLARAERLTTYDAAYLELAMRESVPLATQDDDMRTAADRLGIPLVQPGLA